MGNIQGFQPAYGVPVKNTQTQATHPDALIDGFSNEDVTTSWHLFLRGMALNDGNNRCLGYRERSKVDGSLAAEFTWLTYNDVGLMARRFGSALTRCQGALETLHFDDEPYPPAQDLRLLGIFSKNRLEWFICEQAGMSTVACTLECLPLLLTGIEDTHYVKFIVLFLDPGDRLTAELKERCDREGLRIFTFKELVNQTDDLLPVCPSTAEGINTVCFTSGTTGLPKGVLLTHRNVVMCSAGLIRGPISHDFNLLSTDTAISYLPLAHVYERLVCNVIFAVGASIGIYSGDVTTLLDDLVFAKTRRLMGSNLRYMISGGAPLDAVVQEHMKVLFCAPLMEGYGLTETFGPAFLASPKDPVAGHVGGVTPCCEFKLLSVPEMSYSAQDCPPRGELLIRGLSVTPGYFRDAAETAAVIDRDGWFHTGDVAVLLPGGCVKIIDRRKNIFKLAQGEYVAPEKIEGVYLQAPLVSQMFVFGYSDKNSLVAIVVADTAAVAVWSKQQKRPGPPEALLKTPELKAAIMAEMETAAKAGQLKGFEKVKDIYVEATPFSVDNGLLTPTLKLRRHDAREVGTRDAMTMCGLQRYAKQIQEMYAALGQ